MRKNSFGFMVLLLSAGVWSAPFALHGLHIDNVFSDAVALAEAWGGDCRVGTHRRGEVTFAHCDYDTCSVKTSGEMCRGNSVAEITLGSEILRVQSIRLEASTPDTQLTQAAITFIGDADFGAQILLQEFGLPGDSTGNRAGESWSNSRRLFWRNGDANLSLLKNRKMIMLTTNRKNRSAGETGD